MKKTVLLLLTLIVCHRNFSQCTATAATDGSSFGNNASIGSLSWSGAGNAITSDNSEATAGQLVGILSSVQTRYITVQGFGFAIPAGAAICGIKVDVERYAAGLIIGSSVTDNSIRIIKNGSITGSDQAAGAAWPGAAAYASYGGSANQWGTAWTPADINAANFGVAISAKLNAGLAGVFLTAEIDHVSLTVYYDYLLDYNSSHTIYRAAPAKHDRNKGIRAYIDVLSHRAVVTSGEGIKTVQLFDANLRLVRSISCTRQTTAAINTSGLPPGLYIVKIITQTNNLQTSKLLLQ
jgi:hypothetical protein